MLNRNQLKNYRILRGLSTRDVAACCDISQPMIVQAENGTKRLTEHTHDEIVKGINTAYKKRMESYREAKKNKKKPKGVAPVREEKITEATGEKMKTRRLKRKV